jgi:uncharacterized protein YbjT (DUF2867 family)
MSGLVLVTGETGRTGTSLAAQLERAGVPYRAASRHSATPFDWEQPNTWDAALEEVASVYPTRWCSFSSATTNHPS